MRTAWPWGLAAVVLCLAGCSSDDATSANDVVQSVDGRSAVDTLVALVACRARSENAELDGSFIDYRQARRVRMSVDGRSWGLFSFDEAAFDQPATHEGWVLLPVRSDALVVASLGSELERQDEALDTIGEWVTLLDKHLAPGGHVAEIEELVLERVDGTEVVVQPRLLIPFQISQGDQSAWLGEIVVEIDVPGGSQ